MKVVAPMLQHLQAGYKRINVRRRDSNADVERAFPRIPEINIHRVVLPSNENKMSHAAESAAGFR